MLTPISRGRAPRRARLAFAALPLLALLAACGGKDGADAMSRREFVQVNVALRSVPDTAAGADTLRRAVLRRHRVTEKELQAFVNANRGDTDLLTDVWLEIADALQSADSVRAAGNPPPPPPTTAIIDTFTGPRPERPRVGRALLIDTAGGPPRPEPPRPMADTSRPPGQGENVRPTPPPPSSGRAPGR